MSNFMTWIKAHPRLTAWIVLALGMDGLVAFEARSVGLLIGQWIALLIATTLVAGLCVWIIGWEDDDEADVGAETGTGTKAVPAQTAKTDSAKK